MKNKKTLIAILAFALIIGIGGTIAYFRFTESFDNKFQLATEVVEFKETFKSPDNWTPCTETPKILELENTSTFAIKARVKYEEYWDKLGDDGRPTGERLPVQISGEDAAIKNINTTDWILNADGWYYYNAEIASGGKSTKFIDKVTFNCDADSTYSSAEYHLILTVQTLQADGTWQ